MARGIQIGVLGASSCGREIEEMAYEVGKEIARQGAILLCGGMGGVMEAAARGAKDAGGLTVGILPGASASEANPHIDLRIADALIAVGGEYGTLSEIAIARKIGVPCIGLHTWNLDLGVVQADGPAQAVRYAVERIQERGAL